MAVGNWSTLVLATSNEGKVNELAQLLTGHFRVEGRPNELPETVEDGATLEANAMKKAQEVVEYTGQVALADDTGLFVASLGGRPGVYSARFAGPNADDHANVAKLLAELGTESDRSAYFRTVIVVVWPDGNTLSVEGVVEGQIGSAPLGVDGFGYDPVFIPDEGDGRTFAQMTKQEKNAMSHRGRAVAHLIGALTART